VTTKDVATQQKYKERTDGGYLLRVGHSPTLECIVWLDGEDLEKVRRTGAKRELEGWIKARASDISN